MIYVHRNCPDFFTKTLDLHKIEWKELGENFPERTDRVVIPTHMYKEGEEYTYTFMVDHYSQYNYEEEPYLDFVDFNKMVWSTRTLLNSRQGKHIAMDHDTVTTFYHMLMINHYSTGTPFEKLLNLQRVGKHLHKIHL